MSQKKKKKSGGLPHRARGQEMPAEWLYLSEEEIPLRSIYELFRESTAWSAEYWEQAGALEISIPEAGSVDLEEQGEALEELLDSEWLKERGIRTVYAVTIRPDDYDRARAVMEYTAKRLGGAFYADTEELSPRIPETDGAGERDTDQ